MSATLATVRDAHAGRRYGRLACLVLLLAAWGTFALWTGWNFFSGLIALNGPPGPLHMRPGEALLLEFDAWGLFAGLFLALAVSNESAHWGNARRLIAGCMAFAVMLGRLADGPFAVPLGLGGVSGFAGFFLAPAILLVTGLAVLAALFTVTMLAVGFFLVTPMMMYRQIVAFETTVLVYRHDAKGLAARLSLAALWLMNRKPPPEAPDDSKGARFATMEEVIALHRPASLAAMAFGHIGDAPLMLETDKHVLVMASTRSGKGVTLIVPHLLRYRGSAFVLDPKGENARATRRQRAALNGRVHVLDPFGITGLPSARFNPLSRFTPGNMEAESKALAAALFVVTDRERDHWTAAGQQLLAAVILFVYLSPDVPADKKDLPTVRKVLLGGLKDALNAMLRIDAADGLLRDLAVSFLETPEREFGSIVSAAQRQTEILDNPFMIASLAAAGPGGEVDFKAWRRGTMTVYLCLSAPKFPVFNRWLRLVLTAALDEMTDTLDPPPLPVCFMLDELATLGHLAAVENAVGLAAGYGIQLVTVFQDVAQMRDLYKGRWASFIGNAGVRALFNLDDYDTADYWSKFVGGRLVETRSRQEDIYGLSSGQNVSEAMRPLLPPEKLMMDFAAGQMLVLAQGAHPVVTGRVPYWRDAGLAGLWDDPRSVPAAPAAQPQPQPVAGPAPEQEPEPEPAGAGVPSDGEWPGRGDDPAGGPSLQPAPPAWQAGPGVGGRRTYRFSMAGPGKLSVTEVGPGEGDRT